MSTYTLAPMFSAGYTPNAADQGSFVPLNTSTITEYPSAGVGKYARLVYVVSPDAAASAITTATNSNVSVTTSSTVVLAANTDRKDAVISNYSATGCFLRRGTPAVANQGIYLPPNGGMYYINSNNLYTGQITAITALGTASLSVSEGQ